MYANDRLYLSVDLSCLMARQSIFHIGPISCNFHVVSVWFVHMPKITDEPAS
jgi:hypothetical protein